MLVLERMRLCLLLLLLMGPRGNAGRLLPRMRLFNDEGDLFQREGLLFTSSSTVVAAAAAADPGSRQQLSV